MGSWMTKVGMLLVVAALVAACGGKEMNAQEGLGKGEARREPTSGKHEFATFGGGCFWCMEGVFERIPGVISVVSGYAGGKKPNPTYEEVCDGGTGHAEVVQIEFDTSLVSYERLLDIFWSAHDPTTPNRQGADVGEQYRSIILYHSEEQRAKAEQSKAALVASGTYSGPVVTEILPLQVFYRAEEYHQDYFRKNPNAPYCALVISPKLKKLGLH
jgi:peptide-methionine (S)-S-oxide reductase